MDSVFVLSGAITNQETCLHGFSHDDADKHVRGVLLSGETHVEKMCSNALAMIKNLTDTDIANELMLSANANRKLKRRISSIKKMGGRNGCRWLTGGCCSDLQ